MCAIAARAKTTITVKNAKLAETVMVQTAEEICDACETMDPDADERTKMDNCTDLVYIWCYNSTSRPQDTVAGKAQSSAGQVATSLDGVLELDDEALRARIKYVCQDEARCGTLARPSVASCYDAKAVCLSRNDVATHREDDCKKKRLVLRPHDHSFQEIGTMGASAQSGDADRRR